jgi:hypothetical protein
LKNETSDPERKKYTRVTHLAQFIALIGHPPKGILDRPNELQYILNLAVSRENPARRARLIQASELHFTRCHTGGFGCHLEGGNKRLLLEFVKRDAAVAFGEKEHCRGAAVGLALRVFSLIAMLQRKLLYRVLGSISKRVSYFHLFTDLPMQYLKLPVISTTFVAFNGGIVYGGSHCESTDAFYGCLGLLP